MGRAQAGALNIRPRVARKIAPRPSPENVVDLNGNVSFHLSYETALNAQTRRGLVGVSDIVAPDGSLQQSCFTGVTKNELLDKPVADCAELVLTGRHRTIGRTVTRSVGELLDAAQDADGVYGSDNQPVSRDMRLRDLIDWHCDYIWTF